MDHSQYPHKCSCGYNAYCGINQILCTNDQCSHFDPALDPGRILRGVFSNWIDNQSSSNYLCATIGDRLLQNADEFDDTILTRLEEIALYIWKRTASSAHKIVAGPWLLYHFSKSNRYEILDPHAPNAVEVITQDQWHHLPEGLYDGKWLLYKDIECEQNYSKFTGDQEVKAFMVMR